MADLNLVCVFHSIGLGDCFIFVRIAVEQLADLAQVVACRNGVALLCAAGVGDLVLQIRERLIDSLDRIPNPVLH